MKLFMKSISRKVPELCIYNEIGDSPFSSDPVTLKSVHSMVSSIADEPAMTVRINSVGGSVTEGMAIYNILREFKGHKTVIVEGIAASIASVIAMAGDDVVMTRGSYLMIHNPFAVSQGEAGDLRRTADLLDSMRATMLSIYQEATGLDMARIEAMVDKETYLTADEAVELGFADRVSETGARIAASAVKLLNKPPEALAKLAALAKEKTMDEKEYEKMKADMAKMTEECEALRAKLAKFEKKDGDSDDDDGDEEESSTGTGEDAKASVLMARVVVAAVNAYGVQDLTKLAEAIRAGGGSPQSRKATVEKAVADGKLPPGLKAWAMSKHTPMSAVQELVSGARSSVQPAVTASTDPALPGAPVVAPVIPGSAPQLSKVEREVMAMIGVDEAHMIKARGAALPRPAIPSLPQD